MKELLLDEKLGNFTHLDKVFFPEDQITKGDLLAYYQSMAPYILPYLKNRPESLLRHPHGIHGESFFQKNASPHFPEWVKTYPVTHSDRTIEYLIINDLKSLLFAVNLGCIEINPFSSHIPKLDNPDYLLIDLDPEDIAFDKVVETALAVHEVLEEIDVPNYCKTSGKRGIHIYVPIGGKYSTEQVKLFAELIVRLAHTKVPTFTSLERSPKDRQKKVYLDWLQNNFGQTLAAPYSVRPKPHAPVSTPLDWKEVKPGLNPLDFTIKTIAKRVEKKGDLFAPVLKEKIDLKKALKRLNQTAIQSVKNH